MHLADFLADLAGHLRNGILTGVALETGGQTAHARVARTPQDSPIVAAVARHQPDGSALLALCGVAATPVLVGPGDLDTLDPPSDFRGSKEYRERMARVLARRVLNELKDIGD
jgi:CO/xanthine dehydrogenase FAD-binding subunit